MAQSRRSPRPCVPAVTFRELDSTLMDWYVATGEWQGRSGGYAIQGAGAALVRARGGGG